MAEPKTKVNAASVAAFIDKLPDAQVREDCKTLVELMEAATKAKGEMWGSGIVGFGRRMIDYAGGRQGEWMMIGFAPRKQTLALYLSLGGFEAHEALLSKLGPHTHGKGCLYLKRLSDVDLPTLKKLLQASVKQKVKA